MNFWSDCNHILVIRADNLGDVLLSSPAIRAVKNSFGSKITLLCSKAAAGAGQLLKEVDEVIGVDLPWVKADSTVGGEALVELAEQLKIRAFDACIIFTVYSQSALPAALLAYMAGIPQRLAYCRENPYGLINYWLPDVEPYTLIKHQVDRDLALVAHVGAITSDTRLRIHLAEQVRESLKEKLLRAGIKSGKQLFVMHAGVSEEKRKFPEEKWIALGKALLKAYPCQLLFTGSLSESPLTDCLASELGENAFSLGGVFSLPEFAALLDTVALVISVNTATIHLAAATNTPQIVLYAQTNPQHYPWGGQYKCFEYSIKETQKSKNEVIRYVNKLHYAKEKAYPTVQEIMNGIQQLLFTT